MTIIRKHPEPTLRQGTEWLLSGSTPDQGEKLLAFQVQAHEERIKREQLQLANARHCLKEMQAGNWPVDNEGLLTLSEDNPLR